MVLIGGGVTSDNYLCMSMIIRRMAESRPDDPYVEVKIKYALEIVRSETIKCIIMLVIFMLLHRVGLYIAGLVFLLPLRAVSGGLHFRHESSCLIFSLLTMVLGLIVFPEYIPCGAWIYPVMVAVLVIMRILSPVVSPNKPIVSTGKWKRMKLLTVTIAMIESIIVVLLIKAGSDYGYPMFWILAMQGLQLMPGAMLYGFGMKAIKEKQ